MLIFHTKTRNNMILVSCEKKSWHVNHQSIVPHPCGYRLISAKLPSNKFRRQPSPSRLAIDIIHAMQLKKFLFLATAAILNGGQGCRTPFWRGATLGPSQPNNLVQQFQKRRSKYESLWRTTDARWAKKHTVIIDQISIIRIWLKISTYSGRHLAYEPVCSSFPQCPLKFPMGLNLSKHCSSAPIDPSKH